MFEKHQLTYHNRHCRPSSCCETPLNNPGLVCSSYQSSCQSSCQGTLLWQMDLRSWDPPWCGRWRGGMSKGCTSRVGDSLTCWGKWVGDSLTCWGNFMSRRHRGQTLVWTACDFWKSTKQSRQSCDVSYGVWCPVDAPYRSTQLV